MARIKAGDSEQVKLEKLRINFELDKLRILQAGKTQRFLGSAILVTFFGSLVTAAWAAVRLLDKPAWLTISLAILTALSAPTLMNIELKRHLNRESDRRSRSRSDDEADQPEDGG